MHKVPGGYESDELECFNLFKERTGGVIYQLLRFPLTEYNIENECKENEHLNRIKHVKVVKDKRCKCGTRNKITYSYTYYGIKFDSLKKINYVRYKKKIPFDNLLDLIPYYPYLISMSSSNDGKEFIVISNESYVEQEENEFISHGYTSKMPVYYRKELQNHYKEVINKYNL